MAIKILARRPATTPDIRKTLEPREQLVCRWHKDEAGRLVCNWHYELQPETQRSATEPRPRGRVLPFVRKRGGLHHGA